MARRSSSCTRKTLKVRCCFMGWLRGMVVEKQITIGIQEGGSRNYWGSESASSVVSGAKPDSLALTQQPKPLAWGRAKTI